MIRKLLIANRGEIACRVIKTARRLGIATVAVYSDADVNALHVKMADESIHVGPAPSKNSYLQGDRIIEAAKKLNVDAIHPGYGFLSENAAFANACAKNNVIFIGPPASSIEAMGSKSAAKTIMEKAGVPLVPGYHGDDQARDTLKAAADKMGYPVLLKAAAGGGGKGMRQVWSEDEFDEALAAAKREAMASFGDDIMLVEKYLTQPRHVEIQVFCDSKGDGVYLFERDCSVQRRHQKVIEEAPAPGMTEALRSTMGEAAIKAAQAIDYVGAGTVEFLLDADGSFYFMEMNTRLQVEHPVTELITGEDLVEWQIRIAEGNPLPKEQSTLSIRGHAFEARIYAEDPDNDFLPATGTLSLLQPPQEDTHVRVDTGVVEGDEVSVYYDPMIAKLVVWSENRDIALERLLKALREYHIDGVTTNIEFLYNVAANKAFRDAELVTTFIEKHQDSLFAARGSLNVDRLPVMALLVLLQKQHGCAVAPGDATSPWAQPTAWRANEAHTQTITLLYGDDEHEVTVATLPSSQGAAPTWRITAAEHAWTVSGHIEAHALHAHIDGHRQRFTWSQQQNNYVLFASDAAYHFSEQLPDYGDDADAAGPGGYTAPMNGTIVDLLVEPGADVKKGTTLLVMEAMKMEHGIKAHTDGKVSEFYFKPGELVDGGATLLAFEDNE
ncbi:acetyl/propionyl/methylcrotonyl-CoA carboxylase subunit alpha [Alteromonas sp. ASW11-19]|uniref:Acetyl/propionyl/methylcrotonyl-CoA carboxylase subunit alpha n=1 Tax=Alteromonas salexigens TaxID=2982530 RepID=A0ABT2VKV3_9ALTE|nr:acetyl/propionyl/methylcrotonyl-CoA carboxylase subunit alpha [Alteromonas salexigens]MCU7553923.1 acetyl/propionyl/methylcrotonyl-CoA carboxylase subunit alpha [Alteromonas salexigens]